MLLFNRLGVVGLRAYTQAEFIFHPGMNLLVGVNGVGKTTVLEALRICLSTILSESTFAKIKRESFDVDDINVHEKFLQIILDFEFDKSQHNLIIVKNREQYIPKESGNPRDQVTENQDREAMTPSLPRVMTRFQEHQSQPIGIYFSTKRSLVSEKAPSKAAAVGGQAAAYVEALSAEREFNLRIFAEWFRAQQELGREDVQALNKVQILQEAVAMFLPGFNNLGVIEEDDKVMFVIMKAGTALKHSQLSDGERGVLSIVLDIARRLIQANPIVAEPLKCSAIVLIDELDLHLHPKWQRTIIENLTRVFPNCQFIVTTHSPQIIGELSADRIIVIDNGTYNPASSYGVDSSRILEEVLDTPARNKLVGEKLAALSSLVEKENLSEAKEQLRELQSILGSNDPDVTRTSTMIQFLEAELPDETDSEAKPAE